MLTTSSLFCCLEAGLAVFGAWFIFRTMRTYGVKRYGLSAIGGTFDIIHRGHFALLSKAFSISEAVVVGLTSDEFAARRGKITLNPYWLRLEHLRDAIDSSFPGSKYRISQLDDDFGPAVLEEEVQVLVVSSETCRQGKVLNEMRQSRSIPSVDVVVVPMELADDGRRISTARIRSLEITPEGRLLRHSQ